LVRSAFDVQRSFAASPIAASPIAGRSTAGAVRAGADVHHPSADTP
jgi:hypothetical protein